jgi:hypothetical protein
MDRKCQVTREGQIIGEHDEPTMLALLNAGALRLTDCYWHAGMTAPVSLADYLCRRDRRSWLRQPYTWFLITLPLAAASFALMLGASFKPAVSETPRMVVDHAAPQSSDEVRRAIPLIRGRLEVNASASGPVFPQATVQNLAVHSRVAVVAFDNHQQPMRLASGVVVADGMAVLTSLGAVAGAAQVELHLPNGDILVPSAVIADEEVAFLALPAAAVPVRWASEGLKAQSSACVVNHPLGSAPSSDVVKIESVIAGAQRVHYTLDGAFPSSAEGSAVLNAAGDLAGVLIDPAEGRVLRAADARVLLQEGTPRRLSSLAGLHQTPVTWPIAIGEAQVVDGRVAITVRSQSLDPVHRITLHLRCYASPPEKAEVQMLETQLNYAAVQSGMNGDEATPEAVVVRQALREITARLELARERWKAAIATARMQVLRSELQVIECDLQPGATQRLLLEVNAASNWSAEVTVLEAVM